VFRITLQAVADQCFPVFASVAVAATYQRRVPAVDVLIPHTPFSTLKLGEMGKTKMVAHVEKKTVHFART
jgi:hypothetical protein